MKELRKNVKEEHVDPQDLEDQKVETMKFYLIQHEQERVKKLLQAEGEEQVHTFSFK